MCNSFKRELWKTCKKITLNQSGIGIYSASINFSKIYDKTHKYKKNIENTSSHGVFSHTFGVVLYGLYIKLVSNHLHLDFLHLLKSSYNGRDDNDGKQESQDSCPYLKMMVV